MNNNNIERAAVNFPDLLASIAHLADQSERIASTLEAIAASVESLDRAYTLGQRPAEDEDIPAVHGHIEIDTIEATNKRQDADIDVLRIELVTLKSITSNLGEQVSRHINTLVDHDSHLQALHTDTTILEQRIKDTDNACATTLADLSIQIHSLWKDMRYVHDRLDGLDQTAELDTQALTRAEKGRIIDEATAKRQAELNAAIVAELSDEERSHIERDLEDAGWIKPPPIGEIAMERGMTVEDLMQEIADGHYPDLWGLEDGEGEDCSCLIDRSKNDFDPKALGSLEEIPAWYTGITGKRALW